MEEKRGISWENVFRGLLFLERFFLRMIVLLVVGFLIMMGVYAYNWKPLTAACVILILYVFEAKK